MVALEMVKKPVEFPKLLLKHMKELDSVQGGLSLLAGWPTFTQMYQQVFVWVSIVESKVLPKGIQK